MNEKESITQREYRPHCTPFFKISGRKGEVVKKVKKRVVGWLTICAICNIIVFRGEITMIGMILNLIFSVGMGLFAPKLIVWYDDRVKDTFYLFDLKKRIVWIQTVIAFLLLFLTNLVWFLEKWGVLTFAANSSFLHLVTMAFLMSISSTGVFGACFLCCYLVLSVQSGRKVVSRDLFSWRVLGIIVFNYFASIVLKMIQVQEVQNLCIAMYQVGILVALSWVAFSDRGILVTERGAEINGRLPNRVFQEGAKLVWDDGSVSLQEVSTFEFNSGVCYKHSYQKGNFVWYKEEKKG